MRVNALTEVRHEEEVHVLSRIRTIVTLIFGFVISAGLISCSDVSSSHDTMIKDFDTLLQASHERGLLNGNVVIAKGGEVIYEKSFGYTKLYF